MQASLDAEHRAKSELHKQKKKLETDVSELEVQLDYLNRQASEHQKNLKKLNQTIAEQQVQIEDEARQKAEYHEAYNASERRINSLVAEIEETRLAHAQAERAHKHAESELHDAANHISQLMANADSLSTVKRKLESDVATLTGDLDDAGLEIKVGLFVYFHAKTVGFIRCLSFDLASSIEGYLIEPSKKQYTSSQLVVLF